MKFYQKFKIKFDKGNFCYIRVKQLSHIRGSFQRLLLLYCYTIKIRKKIIKKAKWLIVYGDFVLRLTNGIAPSQVIGLVIPPDTNAIMTSIHSNVGLSK